jgi:hypothetical protein
VGAFGQRCLAGLADVDRTVVEDEDDRLCSASRVWGRKGDRAAGNAR